MKPYAGQDRRRWVLLGAAFLASVAGAFFGMREAALAPENAGPAGIAAPGGGERGYVVGLWVQERTILTPEGARAAVSMARRIGAGVLFVQVLARGEAAYRSSIWPMAVPAGAQGAGGSADRAGGMSYDPLAEVIRGAKAGPPLEVHAWINVYTWGELGRVPAWRDHPLARHPDWVTRDSRGRSLSEYGINESPYVNALFVDPGIEGVRQTVVETVQELVRRYDLDGIHLDYVRYPWAGAGFHPESLNAFWRSLELEQVQGAGASPFAAVSPSPAVAAGVALRQPSSAEERAAWNLFRASQVTALVERIASGLKSEAPHVKLTAAVLPDPRRAYEEALQEWTVWLDRGLLSGVVLMSYTPSDSVLAGWVTQAHGLARGVPVYAGIGTYLLGARPDRLRAQVQAALRAGAAGVVYYSFESLEAVPQLVDALAPAAGGRRR
ncbi:MAG: family 10 glycosylhydrolase [Bacillota bacterium]